MFLKPDQSLFLFHKFSSAVSGTPTAQLYVNGNTSGSPVNGSGSDSEWVFNIILPDLDENDWVEVICSGEVSTIIQKAKLIQGSVKINDSVTPEEIWEHPERSLSDVDNINYKINIPVATVPVQRGNALFLYKGTTWNISLKGVGPEASGYYFTIKENEFMNDAEATLQMNKTNVLFLNSIPQSGNVNATISYSSNDNGTLSLLIKPEITSKIPSIVKYYWDVKSFGQKTDIVSYGRLQLIEDITDRYN